MSTILWGGEGLRKVLLERFITCPSILTLTARAERASTVQTCIESVYIFIDLSETSPSCCGTTKGRSRILRS